MSYKLFTDASYSPIYNFGVVSIDIYMNEILIYSYDYQFENLKSSELEKIGIDLCFEYIQNYNISDFTIFSDFKSSNANVVFLKGHSKKSLKSHDDLLFQLVDKRSRKIMRRLNKMK